MPFAQVTALPAALGKRVYASRKAQGSVFWVTAIGALL